MRTTSWFGRCLRAVSLFAILSLPRAQVQAEDSGSLSVTLSDVTPAVPGIREYVSARATANYAPPLTETVTQQLNTGEARVVYDFEWSFEPVQQSRLVSTHDNGNVSDARGKFLSAGDGKTIRCVVTARVVWTDPETGIEETVATACNSDSRSLTVAEVTSLAITSPSPVPDGGIVLPQGGQTCEVTFRAETNPANYGAPLRWSIAGGGETVAAAFADGQLTYTTRFTSDGEKTVWVECGNSSFGPVPVAEATVTVVSSVAATVGALSPSRILTVPNGQVQVRVMKNQANITNEYTFATDPANSGVGHFNGSTFVAGGYAGNVEFTATNTIDPNIVLHGTAWVVSAQIAIAERKLCPSGESQIVLELGQAGTADYIDVQLRNEVDGDGAPKPSGSVGVIQKRAEGWFVIGRANGQFDVTAVLNDGNHTILASDHVKVFTVEPSQPFIDVPVGTSVSLPMAVSAPGTVSDLTYSEVRVLSTASTETTRVADASYDGQGNLHVTGVSAGTAIVIGKPGGDVSIAVVEVEIEDPGNRRVVDGNFGVLVTVEQETAYDVVTLAARVPGDPNASSDTIVWLRGEGTTADGRITISKEESKINIRPLRAGQVELVAYVGALQAASRVLTFTQTTELTVRICAGDDPPEGGEEPDSPPFAVVSKDQEITISATPVRTVDGQNQSTEVGDYDYHWDWNPKSAQGGESPVTLVAGGTTGSHTATFTFHTPGRWDVNCWINDKANAGLKSPTASIVVYVPEVIEAQGILHVNNDNDDEDSEPEGQQEIDKSNNRIDGIEDMEDLRLFSVSKPPQGLQQGTIHLKKLSLDQGVSEGQIRIFRVNLSQSVPVGEEILAPGATESSLDLWGDLSASQTGVRVYVEGVLPGKVKVGVVHGLDGNDTVLQTLELTVVQVELAVCTIHQLEVLCTPWQITGIPSAELEGFLAGMEFEVIGEGVVLLAPAAQDLTPASPVPGSNGSRFPFTPTIRVLGFAQDETGTGVLLRLIRRTDQAEYRVWDVDLTVLPLEMSYRAVIQGAEEARYADPQAKQQPLDLLGHRCVLEARTEDNELMDGRDIDFHRPGFQWTVETLTEPSIGNIILDTSNPGTGTQQAFLAARPGQAILKLSVNVGGENLPAGHWRVDCDHPILSIPHPAQLVKAVQALTQGDVGEAPIDDEDALPAYPNTTDRHGDSVPVSRYVRWLNLVGLRSAMVVAQIVDRSKPFDGLQDPAVLDWVTDPARGFTLMQSHVLFLGMPAFNGWILPDAPRLNLMHRTRQYDDRLQGGRNSDMIQDLRIAARQYADAAAFTQILIALSIKYDFADYLTYAPFPNGSVPCHAPGRNMVRATWLQPAWWWMNEVNATHRMCDLFHAAGVGEWRLAHPYTRTAMNYLYRQRIDLAKELSSAIATTYAENWTRGQGPTDHDFIPTPIYFRFHPPGINEPGAPKWLRVRIKPDLSWESEWFTHGGLFQYWRRRYEGSSIFDPYNLVVREYHIPTTSYSAFRRSSGIQWIVGIDFDDYDEDVGHFEEAVLYRCVQEAWFFRDIDGRLERYRAWQEIADQRGRVGAQVSWLMDISPSGDVARAITGTDLVTGNRLSTTDRLLCASLATLDIASCAIPFKVGSATRVTRGAAPAAARRAAAEAAQISADIGADVARLGRNAKPLDLTRDVLTQVTKDTLGDSADDVVKKAIEADHLIPTPIHNVDAIVGPGVTGSMIRDVAKRSAGRAVQTEGRAQMVNWVLSIARPLKTASPAKWTKENLRTLLDGICFTAGTPVRMADGSFKPIEQVHAGDLVLSRTQNGQGSTFPATVMRTFKATSDHIRTLNIRACLPYPRSRTPHGVHARNGTSSSRSDTAADGSNEDDATVIETTDNHPFWVVGRGWSEAKDLVAGDALETASGVAAVVLGNERVTQPRGVPVYNFEVAETHTYFVGVPSVWVHNQCNRFDAAWARAKFAGYSSDDFASMYLDQIIHGLDFRGYLKNMTFRLRDLTYRPHLRGAIGERVGYRTMLNGGHIGIKPPTKHTCANSFDFLTFNPRDKTVYIWDAKYSSAGRWPKNVPQSKVPGWTQEAMDHINALPAGKLREQALAAMNAGRVRPRVFPYPPAKGMSPFLVP